MINDVRSDAPIESVKVIEWCESMLTRMDELKPFRKDDPDRFLRTIKTEYKDLDDRLPSVFRILLEYGRKTPDGFDTLDRITRMLQKFDEMTSGRKTKEQAEKELDYEYSYQYVRPVIGASKFDEIVKPPTSKN
jgi:hypothetical protein